MTMPPLPAPAVKPAPYYAPASSTTQPEEGLMYPGFYSETQMLEHGAACAAQEREACLQLAKDEYAACWHATSMSAAKAASRIVDAIKARGEA